MYNIRTDLALERREISENSSGTKISEMRDGNITVTRVDVISEEGAKNIGKPCGRYVTIETPQIEYSKVDYEKTCRIMAQELRKLAHIDDKSVILVVGLGNDRVTPDALGPHTVSGVMVTHHVRNRMPQYLDDGIRSVCAVAPGVLGTTGIETAELVRGAAQTVKPDVIIAVDALATRSPERIGTTIQLSDTGIEPGAGVGNRRDGLDEKSLGAKVIAIGVPTVTDAASAAADALYKAGADEDSVQTLCGGMDTLVMTPKNIDLIIEKMAKTVANGINLALHRDMTFDYIESYVG